MWWRSRNSCGQAGDRSVADPAIGHRPGANEKMGQAHQHCFFLADGSSSKDAAKAQCAATLQGAAAAGARCNIGNASPQTSPWGSVLGSGGADCNCGVRLCGIVSQRRDRQQVVGSRRGTLMQQHSHRLHGSDPPLSELLAGRGPPAESRLPATTYGAGTPRLKDWWQPQRRKEKN